MTGHEHEQPGEPGWVPVVTPYDAEYHEPSPEQLAPYRAEIERALRQLADETGVPVESLNYGAFLAWAVDLNDQYAGRWHIWFIALAGRVEWLARRADAEPVGEPELSAWSVAELRARIEQVEQIERR